MSENLNRLIKEFPRSRWITDAKAMKVEIAGKRGDTKAITQALEGDGTPEDETKIIALQSLFQADPERAASLCRRDSQARLEGEPPPER